MKDNTEQSHQWNMADTITSLRMVSSVILLLFPVRSIGFLAIYSFVGMTDVLDGWIARKTGTASEFGARLDSIADLLFYSVLMLRIFPYLWQILPKTIWWLVMVIVLIRLTAYGVAAVKYHRFAALHTWLNKLTGAAVFLLPYVLTVTEGTGYCRALCVLALLASLEELMIHLLQKEYCANRKSIFPW